MSRFTVRRLARLTTCSALACSTLSLVWAPAAAARTADSGSQRTGVGFAARADARGETALRFALEQRGKPYRYGGSGPAAYDCSGLAQRAWRAAGIAIPRASQAQERIGTPVPLRRIRPGDLVFFFPGASHVGVYAGHGEVVVAPHEGTVIRLQPMRQMRIEAVRRPG
jgi:cell wall-associated NlpC family hydrolase